MFSNFFKSMFGKAVLATAVLGGTLCFAGAPNAQANERDRYERDRIVRHEEVIRRDFDAPRIDYRRVARREVIVHGYFDRFGCWHRY
jgi:hypothetical protein